MSTPSPPPSSNYLSNTELNDAIREHQESSKKLIEQAQEQREEKRKKKAVGAKTVKKAG